MPKRIYYEEELKKRGKKDSESIFIDPEGQIFVDFSEGFLLFENLWEVFDYSEERINYLITEANVLFRDIFNEPQKKLDSFLIVLSELKKYFTRNQLEKSLFESRDLFFEALKKLEKIRLHHHPQNRRKARKVAQIRTAFLFFFVQMEKVTKIREANEKMIQELIKKVQFTKWELDTCVSEAKKEVGLLMFDRVSRRMAKLKFSISKVYWVNPFRDPFEGFTLFSDRIMDINPKKVKPLELKNEFRELEELLINTPVADFYCQT